MDITLVRSSDVHQDPGEEGEDMALKGSQIQGDYSGYVPPEVVVTSDTGTAARSRKTSRGKPPSRGGPVRPASPTEVPIEVRGNLQKLGKRLKGWHQRYFEIQGTHMYYYKNHTKKECLGEINLANCYFCDATSAATFGHPFELRTTERSHTLAARTNDEMVQWVRVIRKNLRTTEEEATVKKATKPKRWDTFKQALSIQPRGKASPQSTPTKKKATRKSTFGNRFRVGRGKDSPAHSRGDGHVPINQDTSPSHTEALSTRPMSFTENEVKQDTLEILAALQPTRSLPATPLVTKRPVDFNEFPSDFPTFKRDSTASPALTLDSTLSTPSHSLTASPAHTVEVEVTSESQTQESAPPSQEVPVLTVAETSTTEAELVNTTPPASLEASIEDETTPQASTEDLPANAEAATVSSEPEIEVSAHPAPDDLPPPSEPEFLKKEYTWDKIQEVLDSAEDGENDYSDLPPEEQVWLSKETGVEQLRIFLLTCP